jgi:hypothetical protein
MQDTGELLDSFKNIILKEEQARASGSDQMAAIYHADYESMRSRIINRIEYEDAIKAQKSTDPRELAELSTSTAEKVRFGVAVNGSTSPETLAAMSKDSETMIRAQVADNPHTPANVLEMLAQDPEGYIKQCIISNPATPAEVLEQLANDENESIKRKAADRIQERKARQ